MDYRPNAAARALASNNQLTIGILIGNILNLANLVSPYLNGAIQGVIIVLAVVLQRKKTSAEGR